METESKKVIIKVKKPKPSENIIMYPTHSNEFRRQQEQKEFKELGENKHPELDFLYPTLDDPSFSAKIASHTEFADTKYSGEIHNIQEHADEMCEAQFELLPQQLFVRNFLSFQTPYNSLLLYHGLGSGKTCSSIGIAEEMRGYMKQVGIKQRIIVVAAPNVQANFRLQLFNERHLREVDGIWNIDSCIGNSLVKEVNPTSLKGVSKEKVISQIRTIINHSYVFMGYVELANYIRKRTTVTSDDITTEERRKMEVRNIKRTFNNRLIIVDEAHNIRLTNDNAEGKTGQLLMKVAKYSNNMRLVLLTATPMYNAHTEIVWLVNLMNVNDKRGLIKNDEVFDSDGNFREEVKSSDGQTVIQENGRDLLTRKMTGYVSYVRGENPYTFPYRIYPDTFSPENTFTDAIGVADNLVKAGKALIGNDIRQVKLPTIQLNGKTIEKQLQHTPLYLTTVDDYQEQVYKRAIEGMKQETGDNFEELDGFGFRPLQTPTEALNMVYPNMSTLDDDTNLVVRVGKQGLQSVISFTDESHTQTPRRYDYQYKDGVIEKHGRIFSPEVLPKYSAKISRICDVISRSKGIVMIYSQYIDGGAVPLALALEEMGFSRFGTSNTASSLFKTPPVEPLDASTMLPKSEMQNQGVFKPAKYVMITGDKSFSPQNAEDIKYITHSDNKEGGNVKVVIISKAGSEGLDFKCIRQVHVLEPWYNFSRIEQIVGRGVRNLSHCSLPFVDRNVEIYLHGSVLKETPNVETADVYVYRLAKYKATQMGQVTRILKEISVDCVLNLGQTHYTTDKLMENEDNRNMKLSLSTDNKQVSFQIGDRPHTDVCDYMDTCDLKCSTKQSPLTGDKIQNVMYSDQYNQSNNGRLMQKIRDLYRDEKKGEHFYDLKSIINYINMAKQYPINQIYAALSTFVKNKNEYLIDKYGRRGTMVNKGDIYAFQPIEINDENISLFERKVPIDYKRETVGLEIPTEFSKEVVQEKSIQENTYSTILMEIEQNLELATSEISLRQGDQNWYKHAGRVLNHIQVVHKIDYDDIVKYVIHRNIDTLMISDKLIMLSHLYSVIRDEQALSVTERIIKAYFDEKMVTIRKRNAFILFNVKDWSLYTQDVDDNTKWVESEPEDVRIFKENDELTNKFDVNPEMFSQIVGFVDMFRNGKEMVFRIKDISSKMQNNTGTRINGQTPGKSEIIKHLNTIVDVDEPLYGLQKSKEIMQLGICVIVEILLRHRTSISHLGQTWYLNPEIAAYNKISKYRGRG